MADIRFPLPDVGEGLTEGEMVQWRVAVGDRIVLDQVFVEIETAKSLVELPSAYVGTVTEILVAEGTTVSVGTPILVIQTDVAVEAPPPATVGEPPATTHPPRPPPARPPPTPPLPPRPRRAVPEGPHAHPAAPASDPPPVPDARPHPEPSLPVVAKPPIRRLAKDLGVDLTRVVATGPIGDITRDDVIREADQASVFRNIQTPDLPTDREDRIPVKGVRKAIATAMVQSAFQAPHVSVFVDVDATRTMEYLKRLKASPDFAGVKVSPLLIMAKAMIWAVRRNPSANAQWTDSEIIVKHYVNLGV